MSISDDVKKFADILHIRLKQYFEKEYPQGWKQNLFNRDVEVKIKPGAKYTKIDVGDSGKFMVDNETGGLYFIKGYGVIDKKKYFGTVENLVKNHNKWWYDGYSISPVGKRGAHGYAGRITEGNGHDIALQWSGLSGNDAKIGRFVVSPKTYRDLDDLFGHEISIDLYDDRVSGKQTTFADVVDNIKKTKYGKLIFRKNEAKKNLSVPEKHQLQIAKKTLRLPDAMVGIMGKMSKDDAREFLQSIGYTDKEIKKMEESINKIKQIIREEVRSIIGEKNNG